MVAYIRSDLDFILAHIKIAEAHADQIEAVHFDAGDVRPGQIVPNGDGDELARPGDFPQHALAVAFVDLDQLAVGPLGCEAVRAESNINSSRCRACAIARLFG